MNCDPIARAYRWLEYASFGRALERRREAFLPEIAGARRVLLLGDGDGRFLAAFLRANPAAQVDSVDSSARMLALAAARVRRCPGSAATAEWRVRFHQADANRWQPPADARYDLIVTHFFLDCFEEHELARLIPSLAAAVAPGARWLVSEFRQPDRGLKAWRARVWISGLYRIFGLATGLQVRRLPDYRPLLMGQGFHLEQEELSDWGLLASEWWTRG